jgi:hypothetical protein
VCVLPFLVLRVMTDFGPFSYKFWPLPPTDLSKFEKMAPASCIPLLLLFFMIIILFLGLVISGRQPLLFSAFGNVLFSFLMKDEGAKMVGRRDFCEMFDEKKCTTVLPFLSVFPLRFLLLGQVCARRRHGCPHGRRHFTFSPHRWNAALPHSLYSHNFFV